MTATDVFFPIVDGSQVEAAVVQTLKDWFLTYTREWEFQHDIPRDSLPQPRSWVITDDADREGEDQLPSIVVVSPGLSGDAPLAEGDGGFRAVWMIGVGVFVSAATREATTKLVRQYSAIIRAIVLQQSRLDNSVPVNHVRWVDESYDDNLTFTDNRTISMGQITFDIEVDRVVHRFEGPTSPVDPGTEWPGVDEVEILIDVKKED